VDVSVPWASLHLFAGNYHKALFVNDVEIKMKILILGAGVIGTVYAWQLSKAHEDVTLFVRPGKRAAIEQDGFCIRYRDERVKPVAQAELTFHPRVTEELSPQDGYDLIIVSVRAQQLESVLPMLAGNSGQADILFFGNNWWGDERIQKFLPADRCLFGLSRLASGWRTGNTIECVLFNNPELVTMLGEKGGMNSPRLERVVAMFKQAQLHPVVSHDILGWLAMHYIEFLGVTGGILQAGSTQAFINEPEIIRAAILATREGLKVCLARGINLAHSPINLRLINSLPLSMLVPMVQAQYKAPSIQQFFEENIAHGQEEIPVQYYDVLSEGKRLGVPMPCLESFEENFTCYQNDESKGEGK
jgi:2-dehydropantoate 2-reductase